MTPGVFSHSGLQMPFCSLILFLTLWATPTGAGENSYRNRDIVIGTARSYEVRPGESLIEIARKFDLGYNEITEANPELDAFVPDTYSLWKSAYCPFQPMSAHIKRITAHLKRISLKRAICKA